MTRGSRESNLGLRIGDTVVHCNDQFVIVDIRREETVDGMKIFIMGTDPDVADKVQRKDIEYNALMEKMTGLLKGLADRGLGGLEGFGKGE